MDPVDDEINVGVATEEDFHRVLRALVRTADSNGVNVRGGWPLLVGDDGEGWDVEISLVRPR